MWKTFYVKPEELGLLYYRSNFQKILRPGTHRYFGGHWSIELHNLNQPQAQIKNLELLLRDFRTELEIYLTIVTTEFNEAAVLKIGQDWLVIAPNEIHSFWRGFIPVEVQKFNLDSSLALPPELVDRLRGKTINGIKKYQISDTQLGLVAVQNNFAGTLDPGEHGFFSFSHQINVTIMDLTNPLPVFPQSEVLIDRYPEFVASYCTSIELKPQEVGLVRYKGKLVAILPPSTRQLFWQGVEIETIDLSHQVQLSPVQVQELVTGLPEVMLIAGTSIYAKNIPASHVGLLYLNEEFQALLSAGFHAWWKYGRAFRVEVIDLRLQTLEVSGQDILSKDKVPLRLNLVAGIRIIDPLQAQVTCQNINDFIYQELQFALRSAVGDRTLDGILEDKGSIDKQIAIYIQEKILNYGVEILSVGVKDIILPGDIKAILSKVVEAEKSAQANVVRRREETAATRSMLNTAKVMEDNPVALRLKELEVLERIAEKIDKIQVNGSLDSILTDLIKIDRFAGTKGDRAKA
jgi:regulator of protease activity HflC (stomatin/prohibitin superfamily)